MKKCYVQLLRLLNENGCEGNFLTCQASEAGLVQTED